jgi:hypothetical protein
MPKKKSKLTVLEENISSKGVNLVDPEQVVTSHYVPIELTPETFTVSADEPFLMTTTLDREVDPNKPLPTISISATQRIKTDGTLESLPNNYFSLGHNKIKVKKKTKFKAAYEVDSSKMIPGTTYDQVIFVVEVKTPSHATEKLSKTVPVHKP